MLNAIDNMPFEGFFTLIICVAVFFGALEYLMRKGRDNDTW